MNFLKKLGSQKDQAILNGIAGTSEAK